jgi:hypothetical protein
VKLAIVILAILGAEVTWMFATVPDFLSRAHGGDYPYYVRMSETPLTTAVPSPWRYRVLNPWLASLLVKAGVSTDVAFLTLTVVFAFLSSLAMRAFLRRLSLSPFAADAGAVLFACSIGGYVPLRRYFGYTDALTNFLILIVLIAALARRPIITAALLVLGTFAKESLLLLVPFLIVRERALAVGWRRVALMAGAPAIVFLFLRWLVGSGGDDASIALSWDTQVAYWRTAMVHGVARWLLWSIAYSMGALWLLAALALPRHWRFFAAGLWLLLPLLAPLVRTTDTERALLLAFPVIVPLAMALVDECPTRGGQWAVAVAMCAAALLGQLTFDWVEPPTVAGVNAKDLVFATLCLVPLVVVARCRSAAMTSPLAWPTR